MLLVAFMLVVAGALALLFARGLAAPGPATGPDNLPRPKLGQRSPDDAVAALDDPLTAAATLPAIVATDEGWPQVHGRGAAALAGCTDETRARQAVEFAEWAVSHGVDADRAVASLCRFLSESLDAPERAEVAAMVRDAGRVGGPEGERLASKAVERLPVT